MNAYITVRKGSERVPDKNIRAFCDTSLLELKINNLKKSKNIKEILVTSDCLTSLEIAQKNGCIAHKRPKQYCSSEVKPKDLYAYLAKVIKETFPEETHILSASVCYPFIKPETYDEIIKTFDENYNPKMEGYSSINYISSLSSCHPVKENLWEVERELIYLDKDGPIHIPKYEAINYTPGEQPASQDLPDIFSISFGAVITDIQTLESGDLIGKNPSFYELSKYESLDIDEEQDFRVAEVLYQNREKIFFNTNYEW